MLGYLFITGVNEEYKTGVTNFSVTTQELSADDNPCVTVCFHSRTKIDDYEEQLSIFVHYKTAGASAYF